MSRLDELQEVVDSPSGILTDVQIGEYIALCGARTRDLQAKEAAQAKRKAEAMTEQRRIAALRGKDRITHALKSRKVNAA